MRPVTMGCPGPSGHIAHTGLSPGALHRRHSPAIGSRWAFFESGIGRRAQRSARRTGWVACSRIAIGCCTRHSHYARPLMARASADSHGCAAAVAAAVAVLLPLLCLCLWETASAREAAFFFPAQPQQTDRDQQTVTIVAARVQRHSIGHADGSTRHPVACCHPFDQCRQRSAAALHSARLRSCCACRLHPPAASRLPPHCDGSSIRADTRNAFRMLRYGSSGRRPHYDWATAVGVGSCAGG